LAAVVVASFCPGELTAGLAIASLLGVVLFGAAEYIALGQITIRPSSESSFVSRHFIWACALAYIGALAACVCVFVNFGSHKLRGSGMIPVLYPGEFFVYHKRVVTADLVRGGLVTFRVSSKSSWGSPGEVVIARILAAPGHAIAIRGGHYQVNGEETGVEVGPVGSYQVVVDAPEAPAQIIVPPDCFFVVQEQPSQALDSRTLSWARREDVLGTKLWLFSRRGLGQALR